MNCKKKCPDCVTVHLTKEVKTKMLRLMKKLNTKEQHGGYTLESLAYIFMWEGVEGLEDTEEEDTQALKVVTIENLMKRRARKCQTVL